MQTTIPVQTDCVPHIGSMFLVNHIQEQLTLSPKSCLAILSVQLGRSDRVFALTQEQVAQTRTRACEKVFISSLRRHDMVYIEDADLWWVVLPNLPHLGLAELASQKLLIRLKRWANEEGVLIDPAVGIALFPEDGEDAISLMHSADRARLRALHVPTRIFQAHAMHVNQRRLLSASDALRQAIQNQSLSVYFQPQISASSRQCIGAEALIRWIDGPLNPGELVLLAEQLNLTEALTFLVLGNTLECMRLWKKNGFQAKVSINLSPMMLANKDLPGIIKQMCQTRDIPLELLTFEVTESAVISDVTQSVTAMQQIKQLGCALSIDDFGTGYSSISLLLFNLDICKVFNFWGL